MTEIALVVDTDPPGNPLTNQNAIEGGIIDKFNTYFIATDGITKDLF